MIDLLTVGSSFIVKKIQSHSGRHTGFCTNKINSFLWFFFLSSTAFQIIPKHWDFYFGEPNKIADRVQYKQVVDKANEWKIYHADA